MTIYVDDAYIPYQGMRMCHMMTDGDIEELHALAAKIGMRREWFQDKKGHPHYDVGAGMRMKAIVAGAVPVTRVELVRICVTEKRKKDATQT